MTSNISTENQTMPPETLEALRGSIAKWESIVAGTGIDKGVENCPLCQRFWGSRDCCEGCPVNAVSGSACENTPYEDWSTLDIDKVSNEAERALAQAELDFLKSLLPQDPNYPPNQAAVIRDNGDYPS